VFCGKVMKEEKHIEKSLLEQIFDEMFANIEGRKEFDTQTLGKLRGLAAKGGLNKFVEINEAIKPTPRGEHENSGVGN